MNALRFFFYGIFADENRVRKSFAQYNLDVEVTEGLLHEHYLGGNGLAYLMPSTLHRADPRGGTLNMQVVRGKIVTVSEPELGPQSTLPMFSPAGKDIMMAIRGFDRVENYDPYGLMDRNHYLRTVVFPRTSLSETEPPSSAYAYYGNRYYPPNEDWCEQPEPGVDMFAWSPVRFSQRMRQLW